MLEATWRNFYRAAILELDRSLLKVRLQAAEDAINARRQMPELLARSEAK